MTTTAVLEAQQGREGSKTMKEDEEQNSSGVTAESAPRSAVASRALSGRVRNLWQRFHHVFGHGLIGLSNGQLWAWRLHDWSWHKAWPEATEVLPERWKGLE